MTGSLTGQPLGSQFPKLAGGEAAKTFPNIQDQINWVHTGSAPFAGNLGPPPPAGTDGPPMGIAGPCPACDVDSIDTPKTGMPVLSPGAADGCGGGLSLGGRGLAAACGRALVLANWHTFVHQIVTAECCRGFPSARFGDPRDAA